MAPSPPFSGVRDDLDTARRKSPWDNRYIGVDALNTVKVVAWQLVPARGRWGGGEPYVPCRTPLGAPHHNCWEHDAVQPTSQGRVIGQPAKDNKTLFQFYFLNLAACTFSDFLSHHNFFNLYFLVYSTHTSLVFVPTLSPLNRRSRPALALLTDACPTATTRPQTAARPQNLAAQTTTSTSKTSHSTIFHFENKKERERKKE